MNVLYISQYYPPEIGAGAFRAESVVRGLADRGHSVVVLSELPNYPFGRIYDGYRKLLWKSEREGAVEIHRVWVGTSVKKNFARRLLYYISFAVTGLLKGLTLNRKFGVIYVTSPPLFTGIVGLVLSKVFRTPYIFEARDLWPELAIEAGEIRGRWSIALSTGLERFLYANAACIVTVTNGFKKRLVEKGINSEKIRVVLNFSKLRATEGTTKVNSVVHNKLGQKKFLVVYAGLIGLLQGVEVIVRAAELLAAQADIEFAIIGSGIESKRLINMASEKNLGNITWLPPQPNSVVRRLLTRAGCSIIPLRKIPLLAHTIPSKLFDYMSYGSPIILSAEGEVKEILHVADAGIAVEPENPRQLADAIMRLYRNKRLRERYRMNGMKAVKKYFSEAQAVDDIETVLSTVCK